MSFKYRGRISRALERTYLAERGEKKSLKRVTRITAGDTLYRNVQTNVDQDRSTRISSIRINAWMIMRAHEYVRINIEIKNDLRIEHYTRTRTFFRDVNERITAPLIAQESYLYYESPFAGTGLTVGHYCACSNLWSFDQNQTKPNLHAKW